VELPLPPAKDVCDVYVDIDGTLLRTDLLYETAWRYLKFAPWRIILLLRLAIRGPAPLKAFLARRVRLDPAALPYEQALLDHLVWRRAAGDSVTLITASHWTHARHIAKHLALGEAYGSSSRINLKGRTKLAEILRLNAGRPFVYAGNSATDRSIWAASDRMVLVNAPRKDVTAAENAGRAELIIKSRPALWRSFLREMRLHQWAKNALIFVPLLTSHNYGDLRRVSLTFLAFLAFGLCASGHYFFNDLLDLDSDRAHATKCNRPLASGDLPLIYGMVGAIVLPLAAFALSFACLPWRFTLALAAYFALTNLYSFYLKRISTADVVALALLYTVRVVAGAAAISVVLSSWLLAFSMFIFVSLAYLKRYIEVCSLGEGAAKGRGYSGADAESMFSLGIANSTAATVVLAFYISSAEVKVLYREPEILWGLCLLMLYWSNRIWVGARRGKIHDDPVVFAIKDKVSRYICLLTLVVVLAARILP
jgi:4-hydroxybenzoate polyprenyltransferase